MLEKIGSLLQEQEGPEETRYSSVYFQSLGKEVRILEVVFYIGKTGILEVVFYIGKAVILEVVLYILVGQGYWKSCFT